MEKEVWLFWVRRGLTPRPNLIAIYSDACRRRNWAFRLVTVEANRDAAGKPYANLRGEIASEAYQRAHRTRMCAIYTGDLTVQLNPTRPEQKWTSSLQRFLRYKAYVGRASEQPQEQLDEFSDWGDRVLCSSERAPQVLPLHTFAPATDWNGLDGDIQSAAFQRRHGPPNRRHCESNLQWVPDPSHHGGREPQNVAGLALTTGFHWDVTGSGVLLTPVEVYKVSKGGHLNIYPSGWIRVGPGAHKVSKAGRKTKSSAS